MYRAQWLTKSCKAFYENMQLQYTQNNCIVNHVWNYDEIGIQASSI